MIYIYITDVIVRVKPFIVQPPMNTEGTIFSRVNLTCIAMGSPEPIIFWYKNGRHISNDNANQSVLIFPELRLDDRGFYHCEARNTINEKIERVLSGTVVVNITGKANYSLVILISL